MMDYLTAKEQEQMYLAHTYNRYPALMVRGEGSCLYDSDGKCYIDLGSGIGVNAFGYSDRIWADAVSDQLRTLQHTSNIYLTQPGVELARALCEKTGMRRVFFGNSGAEANECAIKTARKYSLDRYADAGRNVIVTLHSSFHGRTLATLAATGQDAFHHTFGPFPEGFAYVQPGDLAALEALIATGKVCAFMCEIVQGEGGVIPLDGDYLKQVQALCQAKDVLFIVDEVQTGNGRTGKMYAYEHFDLTPDIVSTAKGLGGGLPIGACLFSEKTKDTLTPGTHGSTFGMNPAVCAGALTVVNRLDDAFLRSVSEKGDRIRETLSASKHVKSICGLGLMLGIETDLNASAVAKKCFEHGVLILTAKTKLRLLPPLNIERSVLDNALNIIMEVLEDEASAEAV